jgi:hypothetical protein
VENAPSVAGPGLKRGLELDDEEPDCERGRRIESLFRDTGKTPPDSTTNASSISLAVEKRSLRSRESARLTMLASPAGT